jgi:hypothetical protein
VAASSWLRVSLYFRLARTHYSAPLKHDQEGERKIESAVGAAV